MTGRHYTISTTLEPGKVTLIEFTPTEMRLHSFSPANAHALAGDMRRAAASVQEPAPAAGEGLQQQVPGT